ncbi:hypothetical protein [Helicobacter sp. MIT 05-5294]|uniref:hypothetical protein n=1 Tax=Helicobacter sp. MIT 05-5294 TaxID=1548150 RepID=UPI00051FCDAD|nr:hypothetical protein [Helicobacter sp. MIT 05-5294]TLD85481.1 hypothetical protein LS69_009280 [Helicobacter sp. MIT 05-5294]
MIQNSHLGSWKVNESPLEIGQEAKEVFEKAIKFYVGSSFELCAHLGTQIVAGTNYAFVCRRKSVTLNPQVAYSLVICYANLEQQCSITEVKDIVKESEFPIGGLHCVEANQAPIAKLNSIEADHIIRAFHQAFGNLKGVVYTPELYIAQQVAKGINYHIIAKAKMMDKEQTTDYRHVVFNFFMNESKIVSIEHL